MILRELHSRLQAEQNDCCAGCLKSGGCDATCCHPDILGGEPSVTRPEIDLIDGYLSRQPDFVFFEAGEAACKFLGEDGKCKIYPVRPIDCRVHFCSGETMTSLELPAIDDLVGDYHDVHEAAYLGSVLLSLHVFSGEG